VDKNSRKMGVGIIFKDSIGEVLVTLLASKEYIIEHDIAEAMAALRAVRLCCELGFYKVVLEVDALQVVQALSKECRN
jgi:hypothetical protein